MERSPITHTLWLEHAEGLPPRDQVRRVVAGLTRACRLQCLLDHGLGGVFAGLALATVVVVVARLVPSAGSPLPFALAAIAAALGVALLLGWLRRPGALEVAIRADVALKLKQRLSTAWEFLTLHSDRELAERLASQAVRSRLPVHPWLVFPLRVNRWGLLAPVAATALLLASVLDLSRFDAPELHTIDERVADEGQRLSAFAREMQARAKRDELPRSARQAERLERLGTRMEGGGLTRGDAVGLLRQFGKALEEEGRQALTGSDGRPIDPRRPGAEGSSRARDQNPGAMIERMLREGTGRREASRELQQYLDALARSGVPRQEAEEALRRHRAGDPDQLRDILEKLAKLDQARREYEELQNARAQVLRAQENLGEPQAATPGMHAAPIEIDEDDDRERHPMASVDITGRLSGEMSRGASRYGKQSDSSVAAGRQAAPLPPEPKKSGPMLKPQGQVRQGEELVTEGQVLPRAGRPSVENVPMNAEFKSQVEEVLSREQVPAHSRDFIRRYFLNLSQGTRVTPSPTQGAQ
jgi:hypothetical protein